MTPLGTLLDEIWKKDKTIIIEEGCYTGKVRMINKDQSITVEAEGLARAIQLVWQHFYGKGLNNERR